MSSIFSKIEDRELIPRKRSFFSVLIISCILLILYITASIFYIITLSTQNIETHPPILVSISIIEIIVTVLSIIVSIIATYISDYYSSSCVSFIEHINRQNEPFYQKKDLISLSKKTNKALNWVRWIKLFVLILFLFYFFLSVSYYISIQSSIIQLLTIIFSLLSTLCTIILALVSSISCFYVGEYTKKMLYELLEDNKRLFDLYNEAKISQSHATKI